MPRPVRLAALLLAASCLVSPVASRAVAGDDTLASGFANPPMSARPRVWWHWMNGNITKDGIQKDIEWMSKVGIGGMQTFDANLMTPQVVEKRLAYMTPEWDDAFRYAAQLADQKGLEFGIASSPGWSESGGPWVQPKDGMKKVVWSTAEVDGGQPLRLQLPPLPRMTGPYQAMPMLPEIMGPAPDPEAAPKFGGEIGVYAWPLTATSSVQPVIRNGDQTLDAAGLAQVGTGATLPALSPDKPVIVTIDYATPQTARSLTLYFPGAATTFDRAPFVPVLEASQDGRTWQKIADVPLSLVPSTAGFAAVTAQHFRLILTPQPASGNPQFVPLPGADMGPMANFGKAGDLHLGQLSLSGEPAANQFQAKAGFATADDYYALDGGLDRTEAGVPAGAVIDLTSKVGADGALDWTPPAGRWKIVRIGYSLTGIENHPATAEATGLEVDKYDVAAVHAYIETYLANYEKAAGKELIGAHGVRALVTDSTEVGSSNWTPALLEQFRRLRGYDARPWLPALTGLVIGTRAETDAFLYDYRRTLADLMASAHYGTIADAAHEHGLTLYGEALESSRVTLGDDMTMRSHTDVPMAAMWAYRPEFGPSPTAIADMRGAASVAHIYGQNLVAAESMTSAFAPWAFAPSDLKPMIDMEFASGVNRPVIHTSVHQPLGDDKKPGLSLLIFGQYFNRNETWAGMARPWVDYIARNAYMLQQGRNVADVAYAYGEEAPLVTLYHNHVPADAPVHYAYDYVSADALVDKLTVKDGALVSDGGAQYRILYLGGTSQHMTLPTLRKIAQLAQDGATIVGKAPVSGPSLSDDANEFAELVKRLWSGGESTSVGKGQVIVANTAEAGLARLGETPDFEVALGDATKVLFVHRELANADIYFVDNRALTPIHSEARFRVTGKAPEIWHADTGKSAPASYRIEGKTTIVSLDLGGQGSEFVVFRHRALATAKSVPWQVADRIAEVGEKWNVHFDGLGAPAPIVLSHLDSLSNQTDPSVKYFSGTSIYQTHLTVKATAKPGKAMFLDLGKVGDVAEVYVNGKSAGIAWKAPYRVDVGALVTKGENTIEIRVANLWVNRLIGDAQPGAKKVTFTAAPTYTAAAPLRPSGLIGPVTLFLGR